MAWAAYLAPLVLMAVCGALLYARASGDFIAASAAAESLGSSVVRFANGVLNLGSGLVSKHVSIGAGGYLALAGSLILGARGLQQYRHHAS